MNIGIFPNGPIRPKKSHWARWIEGIFSMRVLMAEDSVFVVDRLRGIVDALEPVEIVGLARDGDEALQLFRSAAPDVVVLDLQMPKRDGLEVLTEMRTENGACVIIILTNHNLPEFRTACLQAGADFFLGKSTEFDRLPEILSELAHRLEAGPLRPLTGPNNPRAILHDDRF